MTKTLDDLRDTLGRYAAQAPADAGLLPGVRTRAVRLRRRRTLIRTVALTAAIAVAAGVAPRLAPADGTPSASARAWYRTPGQTSITLRDNSPFMLLERTSTPRAQWAMVRNILDVRGSGPGAPGRNEGAEVLVFDPGAFDADELTKGTPVPIGDQRGWYVPSLHAGVKDSGFDGAAVGWHDRSGAWVLVMGRSRDDLVEVARDVRIVDGMDAVSPVTLGWVPPGLRIYRAGVDTSLPVRLSASFGLGYPGDREPDLTIDRITGNPLPLQLDVTRLDRREWSNYEHELAGQAPKRINGADTWYLPRPNQVFTRRGSERDGADMVVRAGECMALLHVRDRAQITRADLERILANARFASCTDATGWRPLLG
ncbi:hypothetical protein [Actinoplanes teichomyceticus]|uniref:Uncharacterized protein n=1 Tax=Actinoplanes teichomyceticus TaxID=1867 RepID=A0A561WQ91_ACTTI|nr:hypothetical protein [Actinoplanes teichomyceticus]TWG26017.1 hypothetical protein FHX34_101991 [Actinoplanes teichomyceticus]GIF11092.1 hypothetical protein Ate01nite_11240 [Actinoplanes teichomyceticus]